MVNVKTIWNEKFKNNILNQQFNLFLKKELNKFLKLIPRNSKILDLGCGNGEKTNHIANLGFNIIGIDSSKEAISYAKTKFPKLKFYLRNALSTKLKNNSFDAIISIAVFHCFLEKDRKKYVKELNRILKNKGFLFQLVLSSEDETMKKGKEAEQNTFVQKSGIPFHLFTKEELEEYFSNFKCLTFEHHKKKAKNIQIAVYTMVLRKKIS